jgi:hypothetical protein
MEEVSDRAESKTTPQPWLPHRQYRQPKCGLVSRSQCWPLSAHCLQSCQAGGAGPLTQPYLDAELTFQFQSRRSSLVSPWSLATH